MKCNNIYIPPPGPQNQSKSDQLQCKHSINGTREKMEERKKNALFHSCLPLITFYCISHLLQNRFNFLFVCSVCCSKYASHFSLLRLLLLNIELVQTYIDIQYSRIEFVRLSCVKINVRRVTSHANAHNGILIIRHRTENPGRNKKDP